LAPGSRQDFTTAGVASPARIEPGKNVTQNKTKY
jgi:hypothetical protein